MMSASIYNRHTHTRHAHAHTHTHGTRMRRRTHTHAFLTYRKKSCLISHINVIMFLAGVHLRHPFMGELVEEWSVLVLCSIQSTIALPLLHQGRHLHSTGETKVHFFRSRKLVIPELKESRHLCKLSVNMKQH